MSIAPTSGSSLPRTTYMPSSSGKTEKQRERCRILSISPSSHRLNRRHALTVLSSLAAVLESASSSKSPSLSGVATRVRARTLANDSSPCSMDALIWGR